MAKRRISTGLKANKKVIHVGDVLSFKITEETTDDFKNHPLGKALKETGYEGIYITINKHKWLELDMIAHIMGTNDTLAEHGLIMHIASGGTTDDFDHEYKDTAPMLYGEPLMDTTFLRFLLDQKLEVEFVDPDKFNDLLCKSKDFYINAAREIYQINEAENGTGKTN